MASSWRQELKEKTGRNSTIEERRAAKDAYVSKEAVDTRMGEGTYDALRKQEIQKQFGTQGYNSGSEREKRRFDRRFNRRLRNDRLTLSPRLSAAAPTPTPTPTPTAPTAQGQNSVIYPWNWDTYQIRPRGGLFSQSPIRTSYFPVAGNPELKPKTDWNAIAAQKLGEGKTMQDVIALQKQLGITADGKWGKQTQTAYDDYQQRIQNEHLMGPNPDFFSPGTYFNVEGPSPLAKHSGFNNLNYIPAASITPVAQTQNQFNFDNFVSEQNLPGDNIISKNGHRYVRFDPRGSGDFYVGDDGNIYSAGMFGTLGNITDGNKIINVDGIDTPAYGKKYRDNYNYLYNLINSVSKNKQGGKMNKIKYFQQGGKNLPTAPDAKEAYKGGTYKDGLSKDVITGPSIVDNFPRTLTQEINSNDTTYIETPPYDPIIRIIKPRGRKASSSDKDRTEYEILKRRFNEGASVINDTVPTGINRIKSYFQQGGTMNQQQDIQQQVIQLVQAAMQGDQKATETVNQIMQAAQQGNQQAVQLAQMIQQIVEQMKGQATMAKWGSKLGYIRNLKYAKGGKTCPTCQNEGKPLQTQTAKSLKNPIKKVEEKACGGKAKKRYFGGYI